MAAFAVMGVGLTEFGMTEFGVTPPNRSQDPVLITISSLGNCNGLEVLAKMEERDATKNEKYDPNRGFGSPVASDENPGCGLDDPGGSDVFEPNTKQTENENENYDPNRTRGFGLSKDSVGSTPIRPVENLRCGLDEGAPKEEDGVFEPARVTSPGAGKDSEDNPWKVKSIGGGSKLYRRVDNSCKIWDLVGEGFVSVTVLGGEKKYLMFSANSGHVLMCTALDTLALESLLHLSPTLMRMAATFLEVVLNLEDPDPKTEEKWVPSQALIQVAKPETAQELKHAIESLNL